MDKIRIQGARVHNLKNVDIAIPKNKLVAITGISGSGKSSLAFDIIFEEGKNQYLQSIGIVSGLDKEDRFDSIDGLGPTVAVRQNTIRQSNPRSTVGSKTGILSQLSLLYASDGQRICQGDQALSPSHFLYTTADGMCLTCQGKGSYYDVNLEQLVPSKHTTLAEIYEQLHVTTGFERILKKRFGSYFTTPFWELPEEIREEVVYGVYDNGKQSYCIERMLRNALEKGEDVDAVYEKMVCEDCQGERVSEEAREVYLHGKRIGELAQMTLSSLLSFLESISSEEVTQFGKNVIKKLIVQLRQLIKFRLGYLSLYREMSTLSGGELQRISLHLNLESKLDSLIYVFDEPMSGLHASEKLNMIAAMKALRNLGNTVIVVEHDKEMIAQSDYIIEIGPKAGVEGGTVVYQGDYEGYIKADTLLSRYMKDGVEGNTSEGENPERDNSKRENPKRKYPEIKVNTAKLRVEGPNWQEESLVIRHANIHYLKDVSVEIPLHSMVGIAGVSGSGKSSLIEDTLLRRLASKIEGAERIEGAELISGVVKISQEPIGRSASSTPASYIGIWDKIRELFAMQPDAKAKGLSAGHFSFHSKGACEACSGSGYDRIFLTSTFSVDKVCPICKGKRFARESLEVTYNGKTIAQVLEMSIKEACAFFEDQTKIVKPLRMLEQMGMGYLTLGQPTSSLSGGEAQRVKLAKELGRQVKGNILYVLDEPTTGLSLYDTTLLLDLLEKLVSSGNSVIVIEHNLEVLRKCDYIIELGPEGGERGGEVIAKGSPNDLRSNEVSITGRYL